MGSVDLSLDEIIALSKKNKKNEAVQRGRNNFSKRSSRTAFSYQDLDAPEETRKTLTQKESPFSIVRINLSNLAPSVTSADLEELFSAFNIETAAVHYNEYGESLGTGDVFLRRRDALRAVKTFEGVALDNEILRMVVVDNGRNVSGRESFVSPRRVGTGSVQKKRLSNDRLPRRNLTRRNKGQKSLEELDAELDAYMKKP